jgi:tetratricopeptide (TPR) repeat protein
VQVDTGEQLKSKTSLSDIYKVTLTFYDRYSDALRQSATPDRIDVIKRNRSLAYLKTKQFDAVLPDTKFPNFGSNPPEKALFRAAEALYFLGRFKESIGVLEKLHTSFPENQQALTVLERAQKRHIEESTGVYDFKLLQREAKKLRPPHLDHATYIGAIEIRKSAAKGRGLFVTRAVKAGDLLLCEKAFTYAYAPESGDAKSNMTLLLNIETEQGFMGGQADLVRITAQKLYCNPSVAPAFTALHHGTYKPASALSVDGKPIVDT